MGCRPDGEGGEGKRRIKSFAEVRISNGALVEAESTGCHRNVTLSQATDRALGL